MRIACTTTFLHGRDRFEAGDVRSVSGDDARLFIGNGWAAEVGIGVAEPAPAGDTTLTINNARHAQEARHG